jgi:N-acetylmuramoyl-L-alanine amidase
VVRARGSSWLIGLFCAVACAAGPALASPDRAKSRTAPAVPDDVVVASDARLAGDEVRTRLILDLSKTVDLAAFTLADPYRVVVDLPPIAFQLPTKAGEKGRGLIKAFRFGLVMQGGSRIVIDAAKPVRVDKAFVLAGIEDQPARLVIDLVATDRESFLRNLAVEAKPRRPADPARKQERESTATPNDGRQLIVVDPGHGGIDAGTTAASGETEKAIVLDFARELSDKLEKSGKYRVIMTRSDDSFISLGERVRIARANKAALFISVHADALPRRDADTRGATVYTVSDTASDAEAARLADAENRADVIAGVDLSSEPDDVADILIDLAQRETRSFSSQFARAVVGELKAAIRLHRHPLRGAGFKVLKAPDVPSVLVELGYVSSQHDLKLMMSEAWRKRATDALVRAVNSFFAPRLAGAPPGGN